MEARNRRQNLIFQGVPENKAETWEDTRRKIGDILTGIGVTELACHIDVAHMIGRYEGYPRLVIAWFKTRSAQKLTRKLWAQLEARQIRVYDDYSEETRRVRKELMKFIRSARAEGFRATLSYKTAVIDGRSYTLDDLISGEGVMEHLHVSQFESRKRPGVTQEGRPLDAKLVHRYEEGDKEEATVSGDKVNTGSVVLGEGAMGKAVVPEVKSGGAEDGKQLNPTLVGKKIQGNRRWNRGDRQIEKISRENIATIFSTDEEHARKKGLVTQIKIFRMSQKRITAMFTLQYHCNLHHI